MKFVFFGTPEFAAIILEKLIKNGFIPEAVVCNPDKPVGRKKIITPPPSKVLAEKYNIQIFQPETLANSEFQLPNSKFDFFVVAAYAKILPKEILDIPRLGTIGVHPSLLPKYRGSSPIQTAILNGDNEIGVALYLMDEEMDHGKIILNFKFQILKTDNYEILMRKLAELGADLLIKLLPLMEALRSTGALEAQDESQATYTKKFKTEDGYIKPGDLEAAQKQGGKIALQIERKIRALNPEPGTWTLQQIQGKPNAPRDKPKRMKILEAILTPEGKLKLKKIQFEGKKPIDISKQENII